MRDPSPFLRGILAGLPFTLVIVPFGLLFGVVATEAGLNVTETMAMTVLIIAGAAQFTALQLMVDQAPVFVILATALAVNLRMAIYSAALTPHVGAAPMWQRLLLAYALTDQTYAATSVEYEARPEASVAAKVLFFAGSVVPVAPLWFLCTWLGAVLGTTIPEAWALDFALPICFIAIVAPGLKTPAHVAAALVSVIGALVFAFVPYSLGLLIAAGLAMVTGALVEMWMEGRA